MKTLLSGIKCTGSLHIGNYFGMILNSLDVAKGNKSFFFLADMHSITIDWSPEELKQNAYEILSIYIASGFDMKTTFFFVQSQNFDHAYLAWIFNCLTSYGRAGDMIEFKEKMEKAGSEEYTSVGLFTYPMLMAADILLYNPDYVPVGEDQRQHVELTRAIAKKFNEKFGETFKLPEVINGKIGKRIKSLQHPEKKMSKSDRDEAGCVFLLDDPEKAVKKIMKAVTDSDGTIGYDPDNRYAVSNLVEIYSGLAGVIPEEVVKKYDGVGYGGFKKDLAEIVKNFLTDFQKRYYEVRNDKEYIDQVLQTGLQESKKQSSKLLDEVRNKVGFISKR